MKSFIVGEKAQGLAEYSIVLGILAIGVIGLIAGLSENIIMMLNNAMQIFTSTEG